MKRVEIIEKFPMDIFEQLTFDGRKQKSNNMLYNIIIDNYFLKVLNRDKIEFLYDGNYFKLWRKYYEEIKKNVDVNKIYGLVELDDGRFVEISEKLDSRTLLDMGSCSEQSWNKMLSLYKKIFIYINKIVSLNKEQPFKLGLETAIWNFNTDGKLFDIDPPRLLMLGENSSFTRKNDNVHFERTMYRNFNEVGMKLNLITTFMLGLRDKNFIINDLPSDYKCMLIELLYDNLVFNDQKMIKDYLNDLNEDVILFDGHPLKILKKLS